MPKTITITLTTQQFEALNACIALHKAEDDDFPGDAARRGEANARDNAWRKLHAAWYAQRAEHKNSESVVKLADEWMNTHRVSEAWRIINMLRDHIVRS